MKNPLIRLSFTLATGLMMLALSGCSTVPVTGRKQLMLVSPGDETQLGLKSFEQTKKETPINRDPAINEMVQRVGKRIAAVATPDLTDAQWEFVVFDSKDANAFCLPGGKVGVYTGILSIAKDDAGLATVIGHEVAHAVARHGAERLSDAMALQKGKSLFDSLSNSDLRMVKAMQLAYGAGSQLGLLKFSRKQELEADHIGLMYMARSGYEPRAALDFWRRFAEYGQSRGSSTTTAFLSTHPVDEVRIQQIQQLLPEAEGEFSRSMAVGGPPRPYPRKK